MTELESLSPLSPSQREALEEAVATYELGVTDADQWLNARGVDTETAFTFRLGVVADDPYPGHEWYRGMLVIPYLDKDRKPLSMRFRCIEEHEHKGHGKYMSMAGELSRVFNVRAIHEAKDVIHITEGEFDAIVLNQLGLPAVAIPGASAWKRHHRRMFAGFSKVWVWGDPDEAGAEFVNVVSRSLRSARGVRIRGGDVTEVYLKGGAEAILSLIK